MKERVLILCSVGLHQRFRLREQTQHPLFVIGKIRLALRQVVLSLIMIPSDTFAGEYSGVRYIVCMAIDPVGSVGQIVRSDLSGHIQRNPAHKPKPHLVGWAVNIMDHMDIRAPTDHHCNGLHPLPHIGHIQGQGFHRDTVAHIDSTAGSGRGNCPEKIQFALFHLVKPVIVFRKR